MEMSTIYGIMSYLAIMAILLGPRVGRKVRTYAPFPFLEPITYIIFLLLLAPFLVDHYMPDSMPFRMDIFMSAPFIAFASAYLYGYLHVDVVVQWLDVHDIAGGSPQSIYPIKYLEDDEGNKYLHEINFFKRLFKIFDTVDLDLDSVKRERPIRIKWKNRWIEQEVVTVFDHSIREEEVGKWRRGKPKEVPVLNEQGNFQYDEDGHVIKTTEQRYWLNFIRTHHSYLTAAICTDSDTEYLLKTEAYQSAITKYAKLKISTAKSRVDNDIKIIDKAAELYVGQERIDISDELLSEFTEALSGPIQQYLQRVEPEDANNV